MRAGARLLLLAADPIKRRILREMAKRPLEVGPGHEYKVTSGGREALFVAFIVERWLQNAPRGPVPYDSPEGKRAVTALAEGWSAAVVHALAREPMTLAELNAAVEGSSRGTLMRHLTAMRSAGQAEALPDGDGGATYAITDWMRAGIAPLIASARIERRDPREGMAPIDALDVEAGLQLSLPLVSMPEELSGTCWLGLSLDEEEGSPMTGATAWIDQGQAISCRAEPKEKADAWACGSAAGWLDAVIESDTERVRTGGDQRLAGALLDRLHRTLFDVPVA